MHKLLDETYNQIHKFAAFSTGERRLPGGQLLQRTQVKQKQPGKRAFVVGFVSIATVEHVELWSMRDDNCPLVGPFDEHL